MAALRIYSVCIQMLACRWLISFYILIPKQNRTEDSTSSCVCKPENFVVLVWLGTIFFSFLTKEQDKAETQILSTVVNPATNHQRNPFAAWQYFFSSLFPWLVFKPGAKFNVKIDEQSRSTQVTRPESISLKSTCWFAAADVGNVWKAIDFLLSSRYGIIYNLLNISYIFP